MSFTYFIRTEVQGKPAVDALARSAQQADTAIGRIGGTAQSTGRRVESSFDGMGSRLKSFIATAVTATTILGALNTAADTTSLDNAIKFAGGKDGVENLAFVNKSIADLNTPVAAAKQGFKILSGGMIESGIAADDQRKIYSSVAKAARVMGLSTDDTTSALIALGQVASKGKVSAEELRGQLGERIPGAFAIAARAMKMTTSQLDDVMSKGNLMATDFLPKFAAEMERTFGPGLKAAMESPRAQFDKFNNSLTAMRNVLGQQLIPTAISLIDKVLIPLFGWTGRNLDAILALGTAYLWWMGTVKLSALWLGIYKAYNVAAAGATLLFTNSLGRAVLWQKITTFFTGGLTAAVGALNTAFWANPIMWVVGALGALAAATVYAWNKFEGFRGFIIGSWEALKSFANTLYDALILPFVSFGKMVGAVISGDKSALESAFADWERSGRNAGNGAGQRIAQSFNDGWNKGIKADKIDPLAAIGLGNSKPGPELTGTLSAIDQMSPFGGKQSAFGPLSQVTTPAGGLGAGTSSNASVGTKASEIADGITGGGGKNINISINSLISQLTLQSQNVKEGVDEISNIVIKTLLQAINSANQAQTN
jgi:tape measure domain-containing protein